MRSRTNSAIPYLTDTTKKILVRALGRIDELAEAAARGDQWALLVWRCAERADAANDALLLEATRLRDDVENVVNRLCDDDGPGYHAGHLQVTSAYLELLDERLSERRQILHEVLRTYAATRPTA